MADNERKKRHEILANKANKNLRKKLLRIISKPENCAIRDLAESAVRIAANCDKIDIII